MLKKLAPIFILLVSSAVTAAEKSDYLQFFDEYQRLISEFDASVSQMYAADAKIMGARKKPDGSEEKMTIDGARWQSIIVGSMENAKRLGDRSDYSDVAIELLDGRAKITATRYSTVDCFTDNRFFMVVQSNDDDQMQIVEQFMETAAKSNCESSEPELAEFLQNTVKIINEQLPAEIDSETQLIRTSASGTKLIYHYVLMNYTSKTLSTDVATAKLQPLVIQQSCNSPNLRPILDQDGSVAYIYRGSDAMQIVKFDIDKSACSG